MRWVGPDRPCPAAPRPSPPQLERAPDDPVAGRLVIIGCSRRKTPTSTPVPAIELYQGGGVPQVRARLGSSPRHRARVRIVSGQHGYITADTPLLPYDQPLTPSRALQLRAEVSAQILADICAGGVPREALVIAEPPYLRLIRDLFTVPDQAVRLTLIPRPLLTPAELTAQVCAVLDAWGWSPPQAPRS